MQCGQVCAIRYENPHVIAVPLRCKQWGCDMCGPLRKRKLISEALSGGPVTFITLTSRPTDNITPNQAAITMSHALSVLVKRIRRRAATPEFEYCAVFEATKAGWPHMHILTRTPYIPQNWLSKNWNDLTGSYIVDIRKIKDPTVAAQYVAKYIGKEPHHYAGTKRYRFSQHYRPPPTAQLTLIDAQNIDWHVIPIGMPDVLRAWSSLDYKLEEANGLVAIAQPTLHEGSTVLDGIQMNSPSMSMILARDTYLAACPEGNLPYKVTSPK